MQLANREVCIIRENLHTFKTTNRLPRLTSTYIWAWRPATHVIQLQRQQHQALEGS